MFTQLISFALMAASALASGAFSPVHHLGGMLPRNALDKRQGYYPSTSYCGPGDTCQESCGAAYQQCASREDLYCFDPTVGEQCCPDLSGNSCDKDYYCSNDAEGTTYCCPNELSLSDCAVAYSLTVSLIRATAPPSASSSVAEATSTSLIHVSVSSVDVPPVSTGPGKVFPTATSATPIIPTGNATYSGPTTPEFTGGAAKMAGAGMALLAGAAGIAGLI